MQTCSKMKAYLFLLVCMCGLQVNAQLSDTSLDAMVQINPDTLQEETIKLGKIKLPDRTQLFGGVRFVDIRPYRSGIGFVKPFRTYKNKKMVPEGGLEHAINSKIVPSEYAITSDSLIIFIKHFWVTRLKKSHIYVNDDNDDDFKKGKGEVGLGFCHVSAVSFIKNDKGLVYCGKVDTLLSYLFKYSTHFATFAESAIDFLLENLAVTGSNNGRSFTEEQVYASLAKPTVFVGAAHIPNGFFMTYNDFKQGKVTPGQFVLHPRVYGYKIEFLNEAAGMALGEDFWGLCYQNQFYFNRSWIFNKLIKSGDTYLAMCGSAPFWKSAGSRNLAVRFFFPGLARDGDEERINGYTREITDFFPVLLNPLTGYVE
jgi:hypothetical protein